MGVVSERKTKVLKATVHSLGSELLYKELMMGIKVAIPLSLS